MANQSDEPVSIVQQLRFLRPTAKFKYAKDHFYMVGKVMHEAAEELEKLQRIKHRLYEIQLSLGAVFHALSNEDDAALGAELLEPILVDIAEMAK